MKLCPVIFVNNFFSQLVFMKTKHGYKIQHNRIKYIKKKKLKPMFNSFEKFQDKTDYQYIEIIIWNPNQLQWDARISIIDKKKKDE